MKDAAAVPVSPPKKESLNEPHRGGAFNQTYIKNPKARNITPKDARVWMIANHLHVKFPNAIDFPDEKEKKVAHLLNRLVHESVEENFWVILLHFLVDTFVLYIFVPFMIYAQASDSRLMWFLHGAMNIYFMFNIFHMNLHQGRFVPYCVQDRYGQYLPTLTMTGTFERVSYQLVKLYSCIYARNHVFWRQTHHDHHIYTNDPENDLDRSTSDNFFSWFPAWLRVTGVILGYCVNGPKIILGNLPRSKYSRESLAYFATYLVTLFVIPTLVRWSNGNGGLVETLYAYAVVLAPVSLMLALLFQVSHNHPVLLRPDRPRFPVINNFADWVQNQLDQSVDWGGAASCFFFGGINMQVEHHIAPAAPPMALHTLSKKLAQNGFRVHSESTFMHAVWQHILFIQYHYAPYSKKNN